MKITKASPTDNAVSSTKVILESGWIKQRLVYVPWFNHTFHRPAITVNAPGLSSTRQHEKSLQFQQPSLYSSSQPQAERMVVLMNKIYEIVAGNIRKIRKSLNLTQSDISGR